MRIRGRNHRAWGAGAVMSSSLRAATDGFADDKGKDNDAAEAVKTESPIQHVIILIGENRGTDHTFGVYKPKGKGQTINNILSNNGGNVDGSPGKNVADARQFLVKPQPAFYIGAPNKDKIAYGNNGAMPQP